MVDYLDHVTGNVCSSIEPCTATSTEPCEPLVSPLPLIGKQPVQTAAFRAALEPSALYGTALAAAGKSVWDRLGL